jgi:hypothetical protein
MTTLREQTDMGEVRSRHDHRRCAPFPHAASRLRRDIGVFGFAETLLVGESPGAVLKGESKKLRWASGRRSKA